MTKNKKFVKEYIQEQLFLCGFNLLVFFEPDELNMFFTIDYECMKTGKLYTVSFETIQELFNFLDEMLKYNQN